MNNMFTTNSKHNIQQKMTKLVMLMVMCADFKIAVKEQQNDTDEKAFVMSFWGKWDQCQKSKRHIT